MGLIQVKKNFYGKMFFVSKKCCNFALENTYIYAICGK